MRADPSRIRVVPHAARPSIRPVSDLGRFSRTLWRLGIDRDFVLHAGTIEPRKNLVRLLEAFEAVEGRFPGKYLLVLAGPRGWKTEAFDAALAASCGLGPHARLTCRTPRWAFSTPPAGFAFPSLYEGFGFPPLEAMACGAPVVASDVSSLPEVVGEAGLRVDPRDAEAIAQSLIRVLADDGLRHQLRTAGYARSKKFSWERTARETLRVYEEAAGS